MIQKVHNQKIDKTMEKVVDIQSNQNAGDSNMTCIYLQFDSFLSIIDQIILSNLQLQ